MLKIEDLHVNVEDKKIIQGLDLEIGPGEIHAIMGPNGSGKSTLANVLSGKDGYEVTKGKITFLKKIYLIWSLKIAQVRVYFLLFNTQ